MPALNSPSTAVSASAPSGPAESTTVGAVSNVSSKYAVATLTACPTSFHPASAPRSAAAAGCIAARASSAFNRAAIAAMLMSAGSCAAAAAATSTRTAPAPASPPRSTVRCSSSTPDFTIAVVTPSSPAFTTSMGVSPSASPASAASVLGSTAPGSNPASRTNLSYSACTSRGIATASTCKPARVVAITW